MDHDVLQPLVERTLELAARPEEAARKELWARHNALLPTGKIPVSLTFENIPDRQWDLMFGPNHLRCQSEMGRYVEFYLKKRIWVAENVPDDHVVWPAIAVPALYTPQHHDWGVELGWRHTDDELGSEAIVAPFADEIDLSRLRRPQTDVDEPATAARLAEVADLVRGQLSVYAVYATLGESPLEQVVQMRGMEQLLYDVYDRPEMVHQMMEFVTDTIITDHRRREARGWINCPADPGGRYQMVPTFRQIATDLPDDIAGRRPRVRDERAYLSAQSAEGLGPKMFAEFLHPYHSRIAELYPPKSVYFHGCERLDHKFAILATLPNLGRQHVSAWSSVERAVEAFGGSVVLEVTDHPNMVALAPAREEIRRGLKARVDAAEGHPMDLSITDIYNLAGDPHHAAALGRGGAGCDWLTRRPHSTTIALPKRA